MKIKILFFALIGILLFACSEEDEIQTSAFEINGYWANGEYTDSIQTYYRTEQLADNQYSFGFETKGKFVERKNAGWCGTPPISYGDYQGSWSINDSIVQISVPYWGGTTDLEWKILSIDNQHLSFIVLKSDYQMDE